MEDDARALGGEDEKLLDRVAVIDFDMLCATVALQTQGIKVNQKWRKGDEDEEEEEEGEGEIGGGVQRMWEGGVLDCLADRRIAIEATCCPCYRFGKNMRRANLGSCFFQGCTYCSLAILALFNFIAFSTMRQHCFLYGGVALTVALGVYVGYFRARIRNQFNITGSDSHVDDCMSHLMCPCCSLCQESRTLEMNNVQDGVWHGRGDTICIGSLGEKASLIPIRSPEVCCMARLSNDSKWNSINVSHSESLVP